MNRKHCIVLVALLLCSFSIESSLAASSATTTTQTTKTTTATTTVYQSGTKCKLANNGSDPCPYPYLCTNGKCAHKNMFPNVRGIEIVGSIFLIFIIGFANAGGVGGATFVLPVFILFYDYNANDAVKEGYAVVLGGLISGVLFKVFLREHKYNRPIVIYDIVLICAPLLVIGAKVGTLANTAAPEVAIICMVWVTSCTVICNMYGNVKKALKRDRDEKAKRLAKIINNTGNEIPVENTKPLETAQEPLKANGTIAGHGETDVGPTVQLASVEAETIKKIDLDPEADQDKPKSNPELKAVNEAGEVSPNKLVLEKDFSESAVPLKLAENSTLAVPQTNPKLEKLLKRETRLIPWEVYLHLFSYLGLSFFLGAIDGASGYTSFSGVVYCTNTYWLVYCMNIVLCFVYWAIGILMVRSRIKARMEANMDIDDEYKVTPKNVWKLTVVGLITGFIGGMIGLGGAVLFVPLLLTLGIPAIRATATASYLSIFTSSTSLFTTLLAKKIYYIDAIFYLFIAFGGATIIANPIVFITKRYHRTAILCVILFCLLIIDVIYYPSYEIWRLVTARSATTSANSLC